MDLFTQAVTLTAFAILLIVWIVVIWILRDLSAMVGLRPGFIRAVLGFIAGFFALPALIGIFRLLLAGIGLIDPTVPSSSGTAFMLAGFGGLTGWLWGVGTFNSYSHEHNGMEHLRQVDAKPPVLARVLRAGVRGTPGFIRWLIPFLRPMLIALVVCVVAVGIFMVLGMIPSPFTRVQTDTPIASAVTPAGSIILPIGADGLAVNKTVFFVIIAGGALVSMVVLAVILALIFGALSNNVDKAKKSAPEPLKTEPPLLRLIDFYVSWVGDILEGTRRTISR